MNEQPSDGRIKGRMDQQTDAQKGEPTDETSRGDGIVGPVLLIGLGLILLLRNMGLLDWNVWEIISRLWPVLLVIAGLDMLIGHRSVWGSLLALVLTAAIIGGAIWLFRTELDTEAESIRSIEQPLEEARQAKVNLEPGIGTLRIDGGQETNTLVAGTIRMGSLQSLQREFSVTNGRALFTLRNEGVSFGPFSSGGSSQPSWDLELNPRIPLSMTVDVGIGELYLDARGLTTSRLEASMGIGQTIIILPSQGDFEATVEGAIGRTLVYVPEQLSTRIRLDTGLAGRQLPATYRCDANVCTSPSYETDDEHVELVLIQAIGHISVLPLATE